MSTETVVAEQDTGEELRRLGMIVSVVLGLLSWLFLWQGRAGALFFTLAAFSFLVLTLFKPRSLKGVYGLLSRGVKFVVHWLVQGIILVVFYLVVTPIAVLAGSLGVDVSFLNISEYRRDYWQRGPGSFWLRRKQTGSGAERRKKGRSLVP